ncbi:MAG: porin [Pseudomonadota bacterium]
MMKRSLAAAVAIATISAGSAQAAEDFKVGVSGFLNAGFLAQDVDNDRNEYDVTSVRTDNVIAMTGQTVLDNGLKVSVVAGFSLDQNQSQNNIYQEEIYIQAGGAFGDVRLGRGRNAGAVLHAFIPSAGVGTYAVDDARTNAFIGGISQVTTATSLGEAEYANRITYFTPRIEGIQLAASFTPETDPSADLSFGSFSNNTNNNTSYNANRFGGQFATIQNEYSLAANFAREFDGVGVVGSFGYTAGDAPASSTTVARDMEAIHAGGNISYAGFTVGAAWGYYEDPNVTATNGTSDAGTHAWGAGARYETGPWGFGASFLHKESTNGNAAFDADGDGLAVNEATYYEAGMTYTLGSGVTTGAGVYYNDNAEAAGSNGEPEDSLAGVVNLSVAF